MKNFIVFVVGIFSLLSLAEEESGKLSHESEASVVIASGNSDTQTLSLKQATGYDWTGNQVKFTASYLLGKMAGIESAKKWDVGLRYDRRIHDQLGAFAGYAINSDIFAGFDTRHTVDVGAKYSFLKTDETDLRGELGYQFQGENPITGATTESHFGRAYAEWKTNWNESVSSKLWLEYLQGINHSDDYRVNAEPSMSVLLTNVFSLKLAYLMNYRNVPAVAGKKQFDSLYTTSLVAKF